MNLWIIGSSIAVTITTIIGTIITMDINNYNKTASYNEKKDYFLPVIVLSIGGIAGAIASWLALGIYTIVGTTYYFYSKHLKKKEINEKNVV